MEWPVTMWLKPPRFKGIRFTGDNIEAVRKFCPDSVVNTTYIMVHDEGKGKSLSPGQWLLQGRDGKYLILSDEVVRTLYYENLSKGNTQNGGKK